MHFEVMMFLLSISLGTFGVSMFGLCHKPVAALLQRSPAHMPSGGPLTQQLVQKGVCGMGQ